jgi:hypothetical protein
MNVTMVGVEMSPCVLSRTSYSMLLLQYLTFVQASERVELGVVGEMYSQWEAVWLCCRQLNCSPYLPVLVFC